MNPIFIFTYKRDGEPVPVFLSDKGQSLAMSIDKKNKECYITKLLDDEDRHSHECLHYEEVDDYIAQYSDSHKRHLYKMLKKAMGGKKNIK